MENTNEITHIIAFNFPLSYKKEIIKTVNQHDINHCQTQKLFASRDEKRALLEDREEYGFLLMAGLQNSDKDIVNLLYDQIQDYAIAESKLQTEKLYESSEQRMVGSWESVSLVAEENSPKWPRIASILKGHTALNELNLENQSTIIDQKGICGVIERSRFSIGHGIIVDGQIRMLAPSWLCALYVIHDLGPDFAEDLRDALKSAEASDPAVDHAAHQRWRESRSVDKWLKKFS